MFDDWHNDWWEEVLVKVASLRVVPRESLVLDTHEVMHEFAFLRPKEVACMYFVDDRAVVDCIPSGRSERGGDLVIK